MSGHDAVVGPVPAGRDPDAYDRLRRRVLWSMPTGLYVVGTRAGDERNLMTVSWVTQVATSPKLVGIGVESGAHTHALLEEGGVFALSLLPRSQRTIVRRFVKPVTESSVDDDTGVGTMQGEPVHAAATGAPILDVALSWMDCEVRHVLALGSHSFFVGEVVDCGGPEGGSPDPSSSGPGAADLDSLPLRMEDTRMNYGG
ncbi:MAG TPA: flavin reductase family protein [Acidimicrobiales bacterium]|nr:flavin reductase family protein [Acidimicrobiales bacterium]